LLAPRLRAREPFAIAIAAAMVALVSLPFVAAGIPLLIVAILVGLYGVFRLPASRGGRRAAPGGESQ